jgi:hypothetical protein
VELRGNELPCHRHHWEDTTLYVLEGELAVFIAGEWTYAPTGSAVFVPRGVEQTLAVMSTVARVLTMLIPAGFERFYQELDAATQGSDTAPAPIEQLVTLAARYGCEITRSHPGRPTSVPSNAASTVYQPTPEATTTQEETNGSNND